MISLTIDAKWSKTATVDVRRALGDVMAMQQEIALHIRRRVLQGVTVGTPQPFNNEELKHTRFLAARREWGEMHDGDFSGFDKQRWRAPRARYRISQKYADKLGLKATRFLNSDEMHTVAGINSPRGYATGGMWSGLQVRNYGASSAMIDFGGSSVGSQTGQRKYFRKGEKRPVDTSKQAIQKMVRNDAKAGTVFLQSRIGLLEMTQDEVDALEAAWLNQTGYAVQRIFNLAHTKFRGSAGNMRLFTALEQALTRPRGRIDMSRSMVRNPT